MKSRVILVAAVMLVIWGLLAGCSTKPDYSARFIDYTSLPDGTREIGRAHV